MLSLRRSRLKPLHRDQFCRRLWTPGAGGSLFRAGRRVLEQDFRHGAQMRPAFIRYNIQMAHQHPHVGLRIDHDGGI